MKISDLIGMDSIFLDVSGSSQSSIFKEISSKVSEKIKISANLILRRLNERERLGSTAVGEGIAIPHAKVKGINKTYCFLFKLNNSISYDDNDQKFVDIIFVIIAPLDFQSQHLLALSTISSFIKNGENKIILRKLKSVEDVYSLLTKFSED